MREYHFLARLYGVRGSYPIAPGDGTKYGGNTTCLLFRTPKQIVIFDAGSGIIQLGKELITEIMAHKEKSADPFHITILFTHTHYDHLIGFPFFAPNYIPGVEMTLVGPATMGVDFEDIMRTIVEPQYYPVSMDEFRSIRYFENVNEDMVVYFENKDPRPRFATLGDPLLKDVDFMVSNMKYYFHPKDGCYNYRVDCSGHSLVFATDVEQYVGTDQRLIQFAEGCDVMIHDAQYDLEQYLKFQGYGHSNYEMACQAALKAKAKKLLLFHHDPGNDDQTLERIEKEAKEIFSAVKLAAEGWEWKI